MGFYSTEEENTAASAPLSEAIGPRYVPPRMPVAEEERLRATDRTGLAMSAVYVRYMFHRFSKRYLEFLVICFGCVRTVVDISKWFTMSLGVTIFIWLYMCSM